MTLMQMADHRIREPVSGFLGQHGPDVKVNAVLVPELNTDIVKVETVASQDKETVLDQQSVSRLVHHQLEMFVVDTGLVGVHGLFAVHHVVLVPELRQDSALTVEDVRLMELVRSLKVATQVKTTQDPTHNGHCGQHAVLHAAEEANPELEVTHASPLKPRLKIVTFKSAAVNCNGPSGVPALSLATREFSKDSEMTFVTTFQLKHKPKNVTKVPETGTNGVTMEPVLNHALVVR